MMQIVEYTEAVDLTMHGMHDVRAAAEAGAVFAVMQTQVKAEERPKKEPEPKAEAKPTPPRRALQDRAVRENWTLER